MPIVGPSWGGCIQNQPPRSASERCDFPNIPNAGAIQARVSNLRSVARPARPGFKVWVVGKLNQVATVNKANVDVVVAIPV